MQPIEKNKHKMVSSKDMMLFTENSEEHTQKQLHTQTS